MDPTTITDAEEEEGLSPIIILIPVVLVVVIISMIVCGIFINRRWKKQAINQGISIPIGHTLTGQFTQITKNYKTENKTYFPTYPLWPVQMVGGEFHVVFHCPQ